MLDVAIVLGSTRPGRLGEAVAKWVHGLARQRTDARYDLVDIQDYRLPLLDEPVPPSQHKYSKDHTKRWAEKIAGYDAFVFVTPEYNHGTSAALKNALDFLFAEWNDKVAGFVGYGSAGGARAIEQLRLSMGELKVADVRSAVLLSLFDDFERYATFKPRPIHEPAVTAMLDEVVAWGEALAGLRAKRR
jgi:NAD(P)H-dependent FMN reductase